MIAAAKPTPGPVAHYPFPLPPPARPRRIWHYSGDVNIEHGGMFYNLSTFADGYVEAVRVTACSETGGPDNCYWVEKLAIVIHEPDAQINAFGGIGNTPAERRAHRALHDQPTHERIERPLESIGYDSPDMLADWDKRTVNERRHIVVCACESNGAYDVNSTEVVQVGPSQENADAHRIDKVQVDKVLRANASLKKYARSLCGG